MRKPWSQHVKDTARPIVTAIVHALTPAPPPRSRDPWYSDAERRAEVNANSPRDRRRWLPRGRGWLRGVVRW